MKVLNKDELKIAEGVLLKHFPKSLMVYGILHGMNRNKPSTLEVIVDKWPDFKVIICQSDPKNKRALEYMKKVTFFCMDEQILRRMLAEENATDWSTYFLIEETPTRRLQQPNMKVLNKDELKIAEGVLLKHFPKSLMVYGILHGMNRNKPSTLEVIVDKWPDFKVIICRPDPKNKRALEFMKKVTFFCMDEQILRRMLAEENAIDWSTYFLISGVDLSHAPMLREVSSEREVNTKDYVFVRLLYLPDSSHLLTPTVDSELESRITSLDLSHVDLVNNTWKFGGNQKGHRNITNLISNFPSYCITDSQGQPVSWILLYDYCAMGMLYTLPEHRGNGYAKVLISTMAKKVYSEGYPVYCFIEEDNEVSYRLFKNLGFLEDPSYRAAWFQFNF